MRSPSGKFQNSDIFRITLFGDFRNSVAPIPKHFSEIGNVPTDFRSFEISDLLSARLHRFSDISEDEGFVAQGIESLELSGDLGSRKS